MAMPPTLLPPSGEEEQSISKRENTYRFNEQVQIKQGNDLHEPLDFIFNFLRTHRKELIERCEANHRNPLIITAWALPHGISLERSNLPKFGTLCLVMNNNELGLTIPFAPDPFVYVPRHITRIEKQALAQSQLLPSHIFQGRLHKYIFNHSYGEPGTPHEDIVPCLQQKLYSLGCTQLEPGNIEHGFTAILEGRQVNQD